MSGTITTIAEANAVLTQTKKGLGITVADSGFKPAIPQPWEDIIIGINKDVQAATAVTSTADIKTLFERKDRPNTTGRTLAARVDTVKGALFEGKGGPDVPGAAIPKSDISGRVGQHMSALDRLKAVVGL